MTGNTISVTSRRAIFSKTMVLTEGFVKGLSAINSGYTLLNKVERSYRLYSKVSKALQPSPDYSTTKESAQSRTALSIPSLIQRDRDKILQVLHERKKNMPRRVLKRKRTTRSTRKYRPGYDRRNIGLMRYTTQYATRKYGGEKKFLDTAVSNDNQDATLTTLTDFLTIPQGTSGSSRVGRTVWIHSIQLRGHLQVAPHLITAPETATAALIVYLFLVQDTQANAATAAATSIWTGTSGPVVLRNMNNSERFKILHRSQYVFNPGAFRGDEVTGSTLQMRLPVEVFYRPKVPIEITYTGGSGPVSERSMNNLMFFMGTDNGNYTAANGACNFNYIIRVRYKD